MRAKIEESRNFKLLTALLSAPGSESIVLINCDELDLRKELLHRLEKKLKKENISIYPLDAGLFRHDGPVDLVTAITKVLDSGEFATLRENHENIVISVYGMEKFDSAGKDEFAAYLNFMRDGFAKINFPVVIWLTSPLADKIAREAPDFWSWRSAFYQFGTPTFEIELRETTGAVSKGANTGKKAAAMNLRDAFNALDIGPLEIEDSAYYVPSPSTSLAGLKRRLLNSSKHDKILLAGPPGCGKSTELVRLIVDLQEKFFVDNWSSISLLDIFDFHHADLLFAMTVSLYGKAEERGIRIEKKFIQTLVEWLRKAINAANVDVSPGDLSPGKLSRFFPALLSKARYSPPLRNELRVYFQINLNFLIDVLNQVIQQVEKASSREVLIIVDDLDKSSMGMEKTEKFFIDSGAIITQPQCKMIYCCPHVYHYLPMMRRNLDIHFDDFYYLHNVMVGTGKNLKPEAGSLFLKEVILKRIDETLIVPAALDKAVYMSGGNLRTLIKIIRNACLEVLDTGKKIGIEEIDKSILRHRLELSRILTKDDYRLLKRIYREKKAGSVVEDERFLTLVSSNSISEYRHEDGTIWFDVHPIVEELLKI